MVILGFVSLGIFMFTSDTGRLLFTSTGKLEMVSDIRQITMMLADTAREANEFVVYREFAPGSLSAANRQGEGGHGDCLVLIFQEPRNPDTGVPDFTGPTYIYRVSVYYRSIATAEGLGPVNTFTIDFPSGKKVGEAGNSVEELVNSFMGQPRELVQLAKGLADQKLFYVLNKESVMVKAEIYHGNKVKEITNTYNFTISPRG